MPKSHEENRLKVCCICFRKGDRPLSETHKLFIVEKIYSQYKELEAFLPLGICNHCRAIITSHNSPNPRPLIVSYSFENLAKAMMERAPLTRAHPDCFCEICQVATATPTNISGIAAGGGPGSKPIGRGRGRPRVNPAPETVKMCSECNTIIHAGKSHNCNRSTRLENLQSMLTPKTKNQLASYILKEKFNEAADSSIQLSTLGKPMTISRPSASTSYDKTAAFHVSHDDLLKMQVSLNLSDKKTLKASQIICEAAGSRRTAF